MSDPIQIITTGDGSHSLLNTNLNETYHSVHGAVRESLHVFIEKGLKYFVDKNQAKRISIFEVGFGTGLNALLTADFAQRNSVHVNYTSIEAFPLNGEIISSLNYAERDDQREIFKNIHEVDWKKSVAITPTFCIQKINTTLQLIELAPSSFDIIFFDAFAPNKQPEMWEINLLRKGFDALKSGGVFVTYCAKGQLKRDLKSIGFEVETLDGPPGKKEMVRALKN